LNVN
jgi:large subunit ribosomal protein L27Ae